MDRWRSGTPETCHSSHHHAVCTCSASFSFPAGLFSSFSSLYNLLFHSFLFSLHPFIYSLLSMTVRVLGYFSSSTCLPPTPQQFVLLFFLPSFALYLSVVVFFFFFLAVLFRFHHLLWQHSSFLLSIFSPLSPSVFHFHSFSFLPIFTFSPIEEKKICRPFFCFFHLWIKEKRCGWRHDRKRDGHKRMRKGGGCLLEKRSWDEVTWTERRGN